MADRDSGAPKAGLRNQARSLFVEASSRVARFEPPAPAELAAAARASAARAARFELPPRGARLQRFGYGLALPFALARATLKDPAARRRYLRVVGVQVALTLAFGVLFTLLSSEITGDDGDSHVHITTAAGVWSVLYATISGVEWVVIALSRDFHDGVSRDASLLTGLAPEEDDRTPRVRIDLEWMRKRIRDKVRGFFVFASVLPLFWLIAQIVVIGPYLSAALLTLWSVYWSGVFAASRTVHGWKDEERAPDPVYLRGWERFTRWLPHSLHWAPKTYGRIVRRSTRSLFAPASRLEARPWELTGLSLARTLRHVPGLYAALRPFYSVAAAHVIVAHDRALEAEAREEEAQLAALKPEAAARSSIAHRGALAAAAMVDADGEDHEPEAGVRRGRAR